MMTQAEMQAFTNAVGEAIDRAKKGEEPGTVQKLNAELGDVDAMIAVAAHRYANDHPCGCASNSPEEKGWAVLTKGN